jgi:hypothetical protein
VRRSLGRSVYIHRVYEAIATIDHTRHHLEEDVHELLCGG